VDQTDKDKDGLYDWLETKGIMATNGKVYYLDSGSSDGDTDGVSDLEELGTIYIIARLLDGTIYIYLGDECVYISKDGTIPFDSPYSIFVPFFKSLAPGIPQCVCIPISDPIKPDSDSDTYLDGRDLYPKSKALNSIDYSFSETLWDSDNIPVFDTIYTTHSTDMATWGQHPELADSKLGATYCEADALSNALWLITDYKKSNAANMMHYYLGVTGIERNINVENLTTDSPCGKRLYEENLAKLEDHVKSVLKDGDCIRIVSILPFSSHIKEKGDSLLSWDWFLTLGDASGAFCVIASRTGNTYTINGTYYVADNYDFEENDDNTIFPGLTNSLMFDLHSAGKAQAFLISGEMAINDVF